MRKAIFENEEICRGLMNAIVDTYLNVVVPWWPARQMPLTVDPALGQTNVKLITAPNPEQLKKDHKRRLQEYHEWEVRQSA